MKTHDVFISYSSKDKIVADSIAATLEAKNIRCWYAPRDIKPGKDWGEEIVKAVSESKVFLLIFSGNSNSSQRVLDELNVAISDELVIIPFRIEKLDPSGAMLLHLSSRHWLDAFIPSWEKHVDALVKSVSTNLDRTSIPVEANLAKTSTKPSAPKKRKSRIFGIAAAVIALVAFVIFGLPLLSQQADNLPGEQVSTQTAALPTTLPTNTDTPTPQGPALGSAANPIIWMYVPPADLEFTEANAAAVEIADQFSASNPDLVLKMIPAADPSLILEALCDGEAHIGSLAPISYLVASQRECTEAKLIWTLYGDIKSTGMLITKDTSDISSLSDLQGKSLCIRSFTSISSWVLPSLEIQALYGDPKTFLGQIIEKDDHPDVRQAVYDGECEAGSTYYGALDGSDLPGVNEHLTEIFATIPMPSKNISFGKTINSELSDKLVAFFLKISSESDNFAKMCGMYYSEIPTQLIEINDYYYHEIRDLFERAGADPEDFLYTGQ